MAAESSFLDICLAQLSAEAPVWNGPRRRKWTGLSPGEPVIVPAEIPHGSTRPFRRPLSLLGFSHDKLVICPKPAAILTPASPSSARQPPRSQASPAPNNKVTGSSRGCAFLSLHCRPVEALFLLICHIAWLSCCQISSTCSRSRPPAALIVSIVSPLWA